jgi:hypothetical protein
MSCGAQSHIRGAPVTREQAGEACDLCEQYVMHLKRKLEELTKDFRRSEVTDTPLPLRSL